MKDTPASRRDRPAKPPLTRQGIIDAALAILRAEGLSKVTMRRIATALDTGAASLYVYVRDTEDLHAHILDALLGTLEAPTHMATWRERLVQLLQAYMQLLFAYPDIARMAMSTRPSGPHYLALVDRILGLLAEGGVSDRDAAWAVDLLLLYATAHAAEHGAWMASGRAEVEHSAILAAIATADPKTTPHVARLGDELMSGAPGRRLWHLDVLLNGLLNTPRPL